MKHLLLFVAASLSTTLYAQRSTVIHAEKQINALTNLRRLTASTGIESNKQTAAGDTVYLSHIALTDTITLYYSGVNSGFAHGMNSFNDKAFAERYDFSASDSSLRVVGLIARFGGSVKSNSPQMVNFHIWSPAYKSESVRPTLFNSGLPGSYLASRSVPFYELGISAVDTVEDSARVFMLSTPTGFLTTSFFVGFSINYTWGNGMANDTVGIYSNKDGERTAPSFTAFSTDDTTINNVNVTQYADGSWHDNAVDNFALSTNMYIFPIVVVGPVATAVSGISQGGFTFYGCYPNPATNTAHVKMSLPRSTDVTIDIMSISGNIIRSVTQNNLSAGEQTIPVETSNLPAGDYIFFVHTGIGNGIASKITIVK